MATKDYAILRSATGFESVADWEVLDRNREFGRGCGIEGFFFEKRRSNQESPCIATMSRPVTEDLREISPVLGVW
jgi:hypothetical protein